MARAGESVNDATKTCLENLPSRHADHGLEVCAWEINDGPLEIRFPTIDPSLSAVHRGIGGLKQTARGQSKTSKFEEKNSTSLAYGMFWLCRT